MTATSMTRAPRKCATCGEQLLAVIRMENHNEYEHKNGMTEEQCTYGHEYAKLYDTSPLEDVEEGQRLIATDPSLTAAVARMLLREKANEITEMRSGYELRLRGWEADMNGMSRMLADARTEIAEKANRILSLEMELNRSSEETARDLEDTEAAALTRGYDRGYHGCMQTLADWLAEYADQERNGEHHPHQFHERIAMELFFYTRSDSCEDLGGLR